MCSNKLIILLKNTEEVSSLWKLPCCSAKLNTMDKTGITVLPNNLLYVWPETDRIRGTPKAEETRTHRQYNGGKF